MSVIKEFIVNILCVFVTLSASSVHADWVFDDEGCFLPTGGFGNCINIYKCSPIIDFLKQIQVLSSETTQQLTSYYCGVDKGAVKVCCPYEPIIPRQSTRTTEEPRTIDKTKLLPSNCGYFGTENNIVGGTKTSINDFPWMALLGYQDDGIDFKCAGTIINDRYILTAAHCLADQEKPVVVRLGEHNLDSEVDCEVYFKNITNCAPPVQDIQIEEIIPHPQFDLKQRNHDIGLIRLASPINTTLARAKPICLPLNGTRTNRTYVDENFVVTGWGVTETLKRSPVLLKVDLPIINITMCTDAYKLLKVDINETRQFCVGGQLNKDSCGGDSGGPLQNIVADGGEVRFVQYGVVSYGPRFCGRGLPGIYTRVQNYVDWIISNLRP